MVSIVTWKPGICFHGDMFLSVCFHGNSSLCVLSRRGVAINDPDYISMTPLHWVVVGGHRSCVEELIGQGADVNVGNASTGNTPLMLAVDCGYIRIATALVKVQLILITVKC